MSKARPFIFCQIDTQFGLQRGGFGLKTEQSGELFPMRRCDNHQHDALAVFGLEVAAKHPVNRIADFLAINLRGLHLTDLPEIGQRRRRHIAERHLHLTTLALYAAMAFRRHHGKGSIRAAQQIPSGQHMIDRRVQRFGAGHIGITDGAINRIVKRRSRVALAHHPHGDEVVALRLQRLVRQEPVLGIIGQKQTLILALGGDESRRQFAAFLRAQINGDGFLALV